jgi:glutamate N-acetyltransferase/amino-acid N-acetyltransferase
MRDVPGGVCAPKGFTAGGIRCGIKKSSAKNDLALVKCEVPCTAAAVYTKNKVYGAPITVTRKNLENGIAQAIVCNSGNANTCNADGVYIAEKMCEYTGAALGVDSADIIIGSTGVIGQPLPLEPVERGIKELGPKLTKDGAHEAQIAIMTTDLSPKEVAIEFMVDGVPVTVGAMAKGSGMIRPNMATMLSFITTDCAIAAPMLQKALKRVVDDTYNMVSVDGDTSTNDMVSVMASGLAGNRRIDGEGTCFDAFVAGLKEVATRIARMIAADGEGATKLLEIAVTGAPDVSTARTVAKSVVMSSLFKAAMFGADANWGRILCAIGYAEAEFDVSKIEVHLSSPAGKIRVCADGNGVPFSEPEAKQILLEKEIRVDIDMHQGASSATAWGCDLTYDYVKINGDYRT